MDQQDDIFAAIEAGRAERVDALLRDDPAILGARNAAGDSPLLAALYLGKKDVVRLLVERGAEVSVFEAAALGLADRVREHLDRDAESARAYSHDGWTALHLAAFFGHGEVAALLLDRGAEVNARSRSQRFARENTPLHAAAANKQVEVARLLVERGADVNARDGSGFTPLALAANSKSDVLMLILLDKGARAE